MLKRLPFILFIVTIASLVFLIIVRTSVLGLRLLSMSSTGGRFLARSYNASIILFLIVLAVFAVVTIGVNMLEKKRKEKRAKAHFDDEEVFEQPAEQ